MNPPIISSNKQTELYHKPTLNQDVEITTFSLYIRLRNLDFLVTIDVPVGPG